MSISAYWWTPSRPWRTVAGEALRHGAAWARLVRGGRGLSNFGDALNPIVIRELFGDDVEWAPLGREDLVCIGSVLDAYASRGGRGAILGSGSRSGGEGRHHIEPSRVMGVRGRLTAERWGLPVDAAIGDPGLVIKNLVPAVPEASRSAPVVLPHFSDFSGESRAMVRRLAAAGYEVVEPNLPPLEVAARIAAADHVLTTSLHAIVFADALDVPVARVRLGAVGVGEPEFKYEDYRSVLGPSCPEVSAASVLEGGLAPSDRDRMEAGRATVGGAVDRVVAGLYEAARGGLPA